jgi:hypothetical protein
MASLDIVISIVVLLLLVAAVLLMVTKISERKSARAVHGGIVIANIESITNPATAFLEDYSADETKLLAFMAQPEDDIKNILFSGTTFSSSYEVCIFFLDRSTPIDIGGANQAGTAPCTNIKPCPGSDQVFAYVKPVLYKGNIANMYVAVCGD